MKTAAVRPSVVTAARGAGVAATALTAHHVPARRHVLLAPSRIQYVGANKTCSLRTIGPPTLTVSGRALQRTQLTEAQTCSLYELA